MFLFLDILSFPVTFMSKKNNAKYHLKLVCPICPNCRRKYRDVHETGQCWWEYNWKNENYKIPRYFGVINWVKSYIGVNTDLGSYKDNKYD